MKKRAVGFVLILAILIGIYPMATFAVDIRSIPPETSNNCYYHRINLQACQCKN